MTYMIVSLHPSGESTSVPKRSTDLISIVSRKKLCLAIFMICDICTGCAPIRFLNAKSPDVTFKKSRELILPFFLEEETHLMHMKCCASASFLNYNLATCTIDSTHIFLCKHSISISRKVVNHAIANAVIWVEFAIVGHAWSITIKQYYEGCSVLSWS